MYKPKDFYDYCQKRCGTVPSLGNELDYMLELADLASLYSELKKLEKEKKQKTQKYKELLEELEKKYGWEF